MQALRSGKIPSDEARTRIAVQQWFGIKEFDPTLMREDGGADTASQLNDHLKLPFGKIADAFERTFLKDNNDADV